MTPERQWDAIRNRATPLYGLGGISIIRLTLLFGSAAVALALILTPVADRYAQGEIAGIDGVDYMATGSIHRSSSYVIHRSVLQMPGAVCIIHSNGEYSGDC